MAVVAIVGFGLAIYQGFFYERRGDISVIVDPPAKVFDIHKSVGGLDVSYAGENLRISKKTLWVISANLKNSGNAEIKKGDFDDQAPLGLLVDGGQIVDTPSLHASAEYLQAHFTAVKHDNGVVFTPSILEPGDTVFISFLVLGAENSSPTISAVGKIAGIKSIIVRNSQREQSFSLWKSIAYAEKWWIQPLRFFFYLFSGVFSIAIVGGFLAAIINPFEAIKSRKDKSARQAEIDKYKHGQPLNKEARALTLIYIDGGRASLATIHQALDVLKSRAVLKAKLKEILTEPECFEICKKCYPLQAGWSWKNAQEKIKDFGFPLGVESTIELVDSLAAELRDLADYLKVDLKKEVERNDMIAHMQIAQALGSIEQRDIQVEATQ